MSELRVKQHPYLNVWVREDGCIFLPQSGTHPARWTFGSKTIYGYKTVKIAGKPYLCHRLVVEAFIQYPIPKGMEVDHINRNRSDNRAFENLRIVNHFENMRNTKANDRVDARGGTHVYEDYRESRREYQAHYYQARRKTHRRVLFPDGLYRWIPHAEAESLLKIPLRDRRLDSVSNK